MYERRPHRFFVGLFMVTALAFHLQSRADDAADDPTAAFSGELQTKPKSTSTDWGVADPIVNTARAKEAASKEESPTGLCDPDTGSEIPPGLGAQAMDWPVTAKDKTAPITSDPDWQKTATKYIQDRRGLYVDNPPLNQVHKAYQTAVTGKPDLSGAVKAREEFFAAAYGTVNPLSVGAVPSICYKKKRIQTDNKLDQLMNPSTVDADCGAITTMQKKLNVATTAESKYAKLIEQVLEGDPNSVAAPNSPKLSSNLLVLYDKDRKTDVMACMRYTDPNSQTPLSLQEARALKGECENFWGKLNEVPLTAGKIQVATTGYNSEVIRQMRTELSRAKKTAAALQVQLAQTNQLAVTNDCPVASKAKPAIAGVGDGGPTVKPKNPKDNGTISGPGDTTDTPIPEPVDTHTPRIPDPVYTPDTPDVPQAKPAPTTDVSAEMGGFLKSNWMWLAGGAVLVGGGLWLYNQHEQYESQKYWSQNPLYLPPLQPNTAVATVTSSGSGTYTATWAGTEITTIGGTTTSTTGTTATVTSVSTSVSSTRQ